MEIIVKSINEIDKWDQYVQSSESGNLFQYRWYLMCKNVQDSLVVYENDNVLALLPLFESLDGTTLQQSTVYVPYGGPVLLTKGSYREKLVKEREIVELLSCELKKRYYQVDFSLDVKCKDIVPYIRSNILPEFRVTYVIDLKQGFDAWKRKWSHNMVREYNKAIKDQLVCEVDSDLHLFDIEQAVVWDVGYDDNHNSVEYARNFICRAIENKCGDILIAKKGEKVVGGLFFAWDHRKAYALYSYYVRDYKGGVIQFLYREMFYYVKEKLGLSQIDLEGSVIKGVERFFISMAAEQEIYFNMHWKKDYDTVHYNEFYDYE